jgi:hypothetical protein
MSQFLLARISLCSKALKIAGISDKAREGTDRTRAWQRLITIAALREDKANPLSAG